MKSNLRVTVDLTPAVQKHGGLGRYAEELMRALVALESGDEFRAFYTDPQGRVPSPPLDALPRKELGWPNKRWRMSALVATLLHLPMNSLFGPMDVFHATDHLLPYLRGTASVFTLHDLIFQFFPQYHLPLNRWFLGLMMPRFLREANAVIAVSECTRRDAINLYGVSPDKITVIHEGVNPALRPEPDPGARAAARARYAHGEPFILFVSTIEPRKNVPGLIDAVKSLHERGHPHRLVVAGRKGWLYQGVFDHARKSGMENVIDWLGYVPDHDLPALYGACEAFVYPSLYEGFGLPPLEAMACGAPVIASNVSSLPEVLGEAALLVDPRDPRALAAGIERVIDDKALREDLRARGLKQAALFTWERTARATLEVYRLAARAVNRN